MSLSQRFYSGNALLIIAISLLCPVISFGQGVFTGPDREAKTQTLSLPFGFYNESFGVAAGYVHGVVGYPQKQSAILATVMAGTKGSAMGFFMGRDLRLPGTSRLFVDPVVSVGYFQESDLFVDGNPDYRHERAGSNESHKANYVEGDGWDNFFRVRLKYVLPVGLGKKNIISTYVVDRGLLVSESRQTISFNPLEGGKTYFELRPFYRAQQAEGENLDAEIKTNGIDVGLFWDNRDFFANPSRGFSIRTRIARDFGWFNSSGSWTNLDAEFDAYFPLGRTETFRQRIIALDLWTAYSPSWEVQPDGTIENRPPAYTGATLGGLWRMRGYPSQRFSDKAAVYYSLECRLTPEWNPFPNWPWLQRHVGVQWVQFVPFIELGRVSPTWSVSELHRDMKWSLGLGFRAWAMGIVARIDAATSDEDFRLQMMVSQPFQF